MADLTESNRVRMTNMVRCMPDAYVELERAARLFCSQCISNPAHKGDCDPKDCVLRQALTAIDNGKYAVCRSSLRGLI